MKKEQTKSTPKKETAFIKAKTNLHCGQSRADKIAAFKRGFFKRD